MSVFDESIEKVRSNLPSNKTSVGGLLQSMTFEMLNLVGHGLGKYKNKILAPSPLRLPASLLLDSVPVLRLCRDLCWPMLCWSMTLPLNKEAFVILSSELVWDYFITFIHRHHSWHRQWADWQTDIVDQSLHKPWKKMMNRKNVQ